MYKWIRFNPILPFILAHDTIWIWLCHIGTVTGDGVSSIGHMYNVNYLNTELGAENILHELYVSWIFNGCTWNQTKEVRYRTSLIQLCNELVNKFLHIYTEATYRTKKKSSTFVDYWDASSICFFQPIIWFVWENISEESFRYFSRRFFFFKLLAKQI